MRNGKFGFGVVGCGVIAPTHVQAIKACPEAELVAEVEVDALLVPEAVAFEGIAERGLAGAGGADDQDGAVHDDRLTHNGNW